MYSCVYLYIIKIHSPSPRLYKIASWKIRQQLQLCLCGCLLPVFTTKAPCKSWFDPYVGQWFEVKNLAELAHPLAQSDLSRTEELALNVPYPGITNVSWWPWHRKVVPLLIGKLVPHTWGSLFSPSPGDWRELDLMLTWEEWFPATWTDELSYHPGTHP